MLDCEPEQELRVAAGLASIDHNEQRCAVPLVPGSGIWPFASVLAGVLAWRCRTADAAEEEKYRGVPGFRSGVPVPASDVRDFAAGRLGDARLDLYLRS